MTTEGLGGYIRQRREARGWSQSRLAAEVGIASAYMSQVESGKTKLPQADLRRRIAGALGVRHIDVLIAAGEIAPEEVPEAGAAPSSGQALAERIAGLRADDRRSVEYLVERLEQVREAEAAVTPPPDAAPSLPASAGGR